MASKDKDDKEIPAIDFDPLKEFPKEQFVKTLKDQEGNKLIVIDPDLIPFFKIMIGMTEKGLYAEQMLLEPDCAISSKCEVVVFLLKVNVPLIKTVVKLVQENAEEKKFIVIFFPRYTVLCKEILEEGSVLRSLTIMELPYELLENIISHKSANKI